MDGYRLQITLFDIIRERVKDPKNWIDEISGKLNLSKSAVYKKVNATSSLSLEELSNLLVEYDISFDQLIRPDQPNLIFNFPYLTRQVGSFLDFLSPLKQSITLFSRLPNNYVTYATHELPIFYWLLSRDVSYFKLYSFARTLWDLEGYKNRQFDLSDFSGEQVIMKEATQIAGYFMEMPSTELWNKNLLGNTLNQIKYFADSGIFANIDDAISLCDSLESIINHVEAMAEAGRKFLPGTEPSDKNPEFRLYHNEIAHTNNTVLVESDSTQAVFTTYDSPNFIVSQDEALVEYTSNWFDKLIEHSLPVAREARRSRMYLFNQIRKRINMTRSELKTLKETGESFSV